MGAQKICFAAVGPGWYSEGELLFLRMRQRRRRGSQVVTETGPRPAARTPGWDQPKSGRGGTQQAGGAGVKPEVGR